MNGNTKYPRTYHVPWSPGATSDDKKLPDDWFSAHGWEGANIVITEKLDGENTCLTNKDVYSRSHSAPTRSPWSKNLWDSDGLIWKVKDKIGENELVYGENLYGEHSIHYDNLPEYFFMFALRDGDYWYSWDEVEFMASIINVPTVPLLWRGIVKSEGELRSIVSKLMSEPSKFGNEKEGVVIRHSNWFHTDEFPKKVCKYVRANHVQTDEHWTKNWKKATLYGKEH